MNTAHVDAGLSRLRADWMAARPFASFLPDRLNAPSRDLAPTTDDSLRSQIDAKLNETGTDSQRTTYKQRRNIEGKLADYLEENSAHFFELPELLEAPGKLRACRRSGNWGERHEGPHRKLVMGWDFKCGYTRLCPDESRAEQRRLVRRYKLPAIRWVEAKPAARRIQKGVVTWPNVEVGGLREAKRRMFAEWSKLAKKIPAIRSMLVSQEDPLSERGDWNVHLNIVLLIEGRFDWLSLIEAWTGQTRHLFPASAAEHFQIKMRELPRFDERALDAALRECIKYPIKHQDMAALDPSRFVEWWKAGKAFRRTRSYGPVLFGIGDPKREFAEIVWHGRVWWDERAHAYAVERAVSLTQGDKSPAKLQRVGVHGPPVK